MRPEQPLFIIKLVRYFDQPIAVACDIKCHKAWGINSRPRVTFGTADDNDFAYVPDDELDIAPADPGTYEGGHSKPRTPEQRMNKWCVRECERCISVDMGELATYVGLDRLRYNQPWKHQEAPNAD